MASYKTLLGVLVAALFLCVTAPCAVAQVEEGFERIQFNPGREVAIRTKSSVVRGVLLGVTREKATIETSSGTPRARQVDVPLSTISSIRTTDGEFQYKSDDDFVRLCEYAARLDGVTIEDARVTPEATSANLRKTYGLDPSTAETGPRANRPPAGGFQGPSSAQMPDRDQGTAVGGFANSGGFGGVGNSSTSGTGSQPQPVAPAFPSAESSGSSGAASTPAAPISTAPPPYTASPPPANERAFAGEGEIIICSNCGNEVAYNSSYGMRCPHCNIQWVADVAIPDSPAQNSAGSAAGELPQEGNPRQVVHGPQSNAGPAQLPPPPPPNVTAAPPQSFDLATMPLWMKAVFFFGSIGLIYYFAFYLR